MWQIRGLTSHHRSRWRSPNDCVTNRSRVTSWTIRWPVCAFTTTAAMLWLIAGLMARQQDALSKPGFYAWLQTDTRSDHAGLSTVVVVGESRFVFDCGLLTDEPAATTGGVVRAVFLTHLDDATTTGIERLLDSPTADGKAEAPLRLWGPQGTREWMRRRLWGPLTGRSSGRQLTAVDLDEGPIAETEGLVVLAIAASDGHFAYVVTSKDGQSVLVATDVTPSRRLTGLSRDVDVAIVRHTDERSAAEFFNAVHPRLAVLVPDGMPATAGGIREIYRGAVQIVPPGPQRIDVPVRKLPTGTGVRP